MRDADVPDDAHRHDLTLGAILLAGGRGSRVDGAVKPLFEVGGRTLLTATVSAVLGAGAHPVTVAAPPLDPGLPVEWIREEPPFGGPVAGIVAALRSWDAAGSAERSGSGERAGSGERTTRPREGAAARVPAWTLVLACDLPRVDAAVRRLVSDIMLLPSDTDGLCLGDATSRPQWLTGVYRTGALRDAAYALPHGGRDAPVRVLLEDLAIAVVRTPGDLTADIDTWEDLERARARARTTDRSSEESS